MIPKKIMLILLSVGLLISFVMPWFVDLGLLGGNPFETRYLKPGNGIAGYEVTKYENAFDIEVNQKVKEITGRKTPAMVYYSAFAIPVLAVVCIVTCLIGPGAWVTGVLAGLAPIAGFLAMFFKFGPNMPGHMTYGAFLALACGISMVVSAMTKS